MHAEKVAKEVLDRAGGQKRYIVALAGAPGSGKSTMAEALIQELGKRGARAATVPMDGFHLDDNILKENGWLPRKGAPHTFDAAGFVHTLQRIKDHREDIYVPIFDRSLELSRAGAQSIKTKDRIVVVEGNYLLLNEAPWSKLKSLFDFSVFLKVDMKELETRSLARWLAYDYSAEQAHQKAWSNDLPNAQYVIDNSSPADMVLINQ